jgi:intein/homing endonuclease
MWKVKVDGKEVIITEDHSIMILRDGYLMRGSVKDLREGDELLTINLEE